MSTIDLKSNIHKIVDTIQNEQLLQTIYDFLRGGENSKQSPIWNSLSEEQKNEVLLSYEESEDDKNLIPMDEIFKKTK